MLIGLRDRSRIIPRARPPLGAYPPGVPLDPERPLWETGPAAAVLYHESATLPNGGASEKRDARTGAARGGTARRNRSG
jgi:hypothetical protein